MFRNFSSLFISPFTSSQKKRLINSSGLIFVSIIVLFFPYGIESSVTWNSLSVSSPHQASEPDTLSGNFTLVGTTGNITVEVALAPGVRYVPNTASFSGGASLISEDISDLNSPVFSLSSPSGAIDFELLRRTFCGAYDQQVAGGVLIDTVRVLEDGSQISGDELTDQYALSYGVLSMGSVVTSPTTALIGEQVSRSLTITNGNFGAIDTF